MRGDGSGDVCMEDCATQKGFAVQLFVLIMRPWRLYKLDSLTRCPSDDNDVHPYAVLLTGNLWDLCGTAHYRTLI